MLYKKLDQALIAVPDAVLDQSMLQCYHMESHKETKGFVLISTDRSKTHAKNCCLARISNGTL